jgi:polysaccharide export outer membrane protein
MHPFDIMAPFKRTDRGVGAKLLLAAIISQAISCISLAAGNTEQQTAYVLSKLDVVSVLVFGEKDLSKTQRIDGSGNIRMGLIGTVDIEGLTLREAELKLESAYTEQRFLRDPQVSLQVEEYAPQYISVLGQVTKPGRVQLENESNGIRLVDAISAVGGFSGIAKADAVRVTRAGADGSEETVIIDAEAIINGRPSDAPTHFLTLQPGDVVFVPERLF